MQFELVSPIFQSESSTFASTYTSVTVNNMCGMKTETVPVVFGALGLVRKAIDNFTNCVPGHINIQAA